LKVDNTNIILNADASGSGTARNAAINIRDNGWDTQGYLKVSSDGKQFQCKAPENSYVLSMPVLTQNATLVKSDDDFLTSTSNLDRTKISADASAKNYVVFNDASTGALSSEQFVSCAQGGLAADVSAMSGYLKLDGSGNVSADAGPSMTIADGSITNAKIAWNAAIDRSKIAADSNSSNYGKFLMNDRTTGAITYAPIQYSSINNKLIFSPSNSIGLYQRIEYGSDIIQDEIQAFNISDQAAHNLMSDGLTAGVIYLFEFKVSCRASSGESGIITGKAKVVQGASNTKPSISSIVDYFKLFDSGFDCDLTLDQTSSNANFQLSCYNNTAGKTVNFKGILTRYGCA